MNINESRKFFPITEKAIYLNHAAIGPMPIPVIEECKKWLVHHKSYGDLYFRPLDEFLEEFNEYRITVGRFINAKNPEEEIAFTYNTSAGLAAIAEGLPWEKKGGKIILNDLEYTSNSYLYQVLANKYSLEIEVIRNVNGRLSLEDFSQVIDTNTRLVAISHVQFSNGFRINLKKLANICHDYDSYIIVDAIQSLGAVPLDVQTQDIDFLAAGGYKWLLSQFGTGLFYIRRDIADELNPSFVGSMSHATPLKSLSHQSYIPASGAKRFQSSLGPNAVLVAKAVEFLEKIGIKLIFKRILSLTNLIIEYIEDDKKLTLKTPNENYKERSGIVNFSCPSDEDMVLKLRKISTPIAIAYREGGLRVSPHFYNTEDEIICCMESIKSFS